MSGIRMASRILRYMWALPATAVGLLLALPAVALGATARVVEGVVEIGGGNVAQAMPLLPRRCRFSAITFGHVVIGVDHRVMAEVRAHERVHVRQYERWGVLFFPLYLGSSLWQLLRGRSPYYGNWFEREAFSTAPPSNLLLHAKGPRDPAR
jgi:hypothetical protein